jgi:hypothetical protein
MVWKSNEDFILVYSSPGMVVYVYNPSHSGSGGRRVVSSRPALAKVSETQVRGMVQVVECLPSMSEVLGTIKNERKQIHNSVVLGTFTKLYTHHH